MKHQQDMIDYFSINKSKAQLYKKFGSVSCRLAVPGEVIVTSLAGQVETQNTATKGDVVIKGVKGEEYILALNKFSARYKVDSPVAEAYRTYEPSATCLAFEYEGEDMQFMAPWGETMVLNRGDYLATTQCDIPEVYRIEREAFFATYKLAH